MGFLGKSNTKDNFKEGRECRNPGYAPMFGALARSLVTADDICNHFKYPFICPICRQILYEYVVCADEHASDLTWPRCRLMRTSHSLSRAPENSESTQQYGAIGSFQNESMATVLLRMLFRGLPGLLPILLPKYSDQKLSIPNTMMEVTRSSLCESCQMQGRRATQVDTTTIG